MLVRVLEHIEFLANRHEHKVKKMGFCDELHYRTYADGDTLTDSQTSSSEGTGEG